MKVVLQRHARDFCIYRSLAIAQAFKEAGATVSIECLEEARRALTLTPEIGWKNPHHPFEVSERKFTDGKGQEQTRKGGKLFDLVVNIDGDGPFEARWAGLGLPWWEWAKTEARTARPDLPFIADWPEITAPLPVAAIGGTPKPYVLVAVLSDEAMPQGLNVMAVRDFVKARFPDCEIFWSAARPALIAEGFSTLVADSYLQLATQIRYAEAVFAVNGMAGAIARSFFNGTPLAKRFWYIQPAPEVRKAPQPTHAHPNPPGPGPVPKPDPFAAIQGLLAARPSPAQGGVLTFATADSCTETQPGPD